MRTLKSLAVSAFALVLLTACGSSGIGDILGGGADNQQSSYEIRGTVESVDLNNRSLFLTNVSGTSSMLSSGGGSTARVYFDDRTPVEYQGQNYRPQDLERGDQVAVRVDESGSRLEATSVRVIHDVSSGSVGSGTSGTTLRGTVRYVDTSRRTIEVDRGYGSTTMVDYDADTPVYFDGRTFRAADLERGDEIEIRTRDLGNGRLLANEITVTRNVSGGTFGSSTNMSTLRGTVRSIDTVRRLIELESASWMSSFNSSTGSGTRFTVQYDSSARVEVQGQLHPITNLERGDVIDVQVRNRDAATPFAERILLVRDVNSR